MRNPLAAAAGILLFLATEARAEVDADAPPVRTVIHAGVLIAEPGKPTLVNQSIIIEGGTIFAVTDGFVGGDDAIDLSDRTVLPGLIDMHTHVTGFEELDPAHPTGWIMQRALARQSRSALDAVPVLGAILQRGFTTIRNLGDPAGVTYDLRDAIAEGKIVGPRMVVSEPQITAGGGDLRASQFGVRAAVEPFLANRGECNGAEDCSRIVREEIARGADVIKFRLSDLAFVDPKIETFETPAEVTAIIGTAHRLGRKVAVHTAFVDRETLLAVAAGADTIEHAPVDREILAAMKRSGTVFVPTLSASAFFAPILARLGIQRDFYGEALDSVRQAHQDGIMLAYGTDLLPLTADRQAYEFEEFVNAGLSPEEALMTATVNAAVALGLSNTIGKIAPGMTADVIAVEGDPLKDVGVLQNVSFVMTNGTIIKQ